MYNDNNETYQEMFKLLKNNKYTEFITYVDKIEKDDITFDINIKDIQNNYFLTYAISLNQPDIVKKLIDKGANIDIVDKYNKSVICTAIKYSYIEIVKILLDANKNNIGISIIDIKDKNLRIPLHYAISLENLECVKLLLEYGSNPNIVTKDGYNSLHLAVKSRSFEMCELIIQYIADINGKCETGETAIHIACNLQLINIVVLLINNKININVTDHSHEITPLHYSVLLNNSNLIAILLKHGANPNIQDIYGNTPLHYSIIENNFEIFMLLTNSIVTKNIINMNMWNIDGEIPLHLVLKNNSENITDYIDQIISKSNLSIQNNEGNTCLHYLIKLDLWKIYTSVLEKKRLDIFVQNYMKISPLEMIKKNNYDEFIDIVVNSYIYRLKLANKYWYTEWENICSKNFENIEKKDLEKISHDQHISFDSITNKNFVPLCKELIKNKILNLITKIKNIRNNNELNCDDKTYPVPKSVICIKIIEGVKLDYCTFTGGTLDVLIGLIYLLKKHKNCCATLTTKYAENKDLCKLYKSMGNLVSSKCEFLNFEITWVYQKLYLITDFYDQFKKCLSKNKQFIIVPIGIEIEKGRHAGYIIYDKTTNEVERFEPHGSTTPPGYYYNPTLLDELLEARFKTIDENIKYISPSKYLPKIGFQLMDVSENKKKRIGDPLGFCALWSIWYVDMKLTYPTTDRQELVNILIRTIKASNVSFRNMIRNYGKYIIEIRDKILKKSQLDINDWTNDEYTDIQINNVIKNINEEIESITQK